MENKITQEEILVLIETRELTIEKVINTIVDANSLIGVGLITLGETLQIYTILNKQLRRPGITKEEIGQIIHNYKNRN